MKVECWVQLNPEGSGAELVLQEEQTCLPAFLQDLEQLLFSFLHQ